MFYWSDVLKGSLNESRHWQFMQNNGPESLFDGYRESLDYLARAACLLGCRTSGLLLCSSFDLLSTDLDMHPHKACTV